MNLQMQYAYDFGKFKSEFADFGIIRFPYLGGGING